MHVTNAYFRKALLWEFKDGRVLFNYLLILVLTSIPGSKIHFWSESDWSQVSFSGTFFVRFFS